MTDQPTKATKTDGVINDTSIQKVSELTKTLGEDGTFNLLQNIEGKYFEYLIDKINKDKDKLYKRGVTGSQLKMIANIMLTYAIDGLLQYKTALNQYDAKKLDEIYGQNYEEWEDSMIDKYLTEKKKAEANKEPAKPQVEPEKPKQNPIDLLDGSDLG